jgi:DNA-binding NtrC family response regulator
MTATADVRVLVIWRERASADWLRRLLEGLGMVVESGDVTALDEAQGGELARFDVVLFEAWDLGEAELALLQRAREASPLTEIVALAKRALVDDAVQALRSGAFAILSRPVRDDEVARTTLAACERKRRAEGRLKALGELGRGVGPGTGDAPASPSVEPMAGRRES